MNGQGNDELVVVGSDGSWQSLEAVEVATTEAARRGSDLVVLTVLSNDGRPSGLSNQRGFDENALRSARAIATRAATRAEEVDDTVTVHVEVLTSLEDLVLADLIERCSLLVLGGHSAGGQVAFSDGSSSSEFMRRFTAPVLIPRRQLTPRRNEAARPAEVHVGLSLARDEAALLSAAADQAAARGSSLRVIHALPQGCPPHRVGTEQEKTWRAIRTSADLIDVPVLVDVVRGDPMTTLVDGCGPDDLLVVGTRGGGTLAGFIPGSVARSVLDRSPCDVLVVPPGLEPGRGSARTAAGSRSSARRSTTVLPAG